MTRSWTSLPRARLGSRLAPPPTILPFADRLFRYLGLRTACPSTESSFDLPPARVLLILRDGGPPTSLARPRSLRTVCPDHLHTRESRAFNASGSSSLAPPSETLNAPDQCRVGPRSNSCPPRLNCAAGAIGPCLARGRAARRGPKTPSSEGIRRRGL